MVIFQNVQYFVDIWETSIDNEVQMRESFFQLEDLRVLQGRYRAILFWVEALKVSFASMNDELSCSTLLTYNPDKVLNMLPLVEVVNT